MEILRKAINPMGFARLWAAMALLAATLPAFAQREPHAFFKDVIKLEASEIQKIERGEVITKVMESEDKYGILVFGATYVNAPVEKFADVFRDVEKLRQEKVYLDVQAFGKLGSPAKPEDFARMTLDKGDIDDLQKCTTGRCEIQVMDPDHLRAEINWKAPDKHAEVNKYLRGDAAAGMNDYFEGGLRSFGEYRDRENPYDIFQETKEMVDRSYYLPKDWAPDIYNHVVEFPEKKMEGVEDVYYWEKIDFGQGPVIRLNHVTLFPKGVGAVKLLAVNKQLYASKYMRVALQLYYCVPDTANPNKPGFYLIQMNDSRMPDFGWLKLNVVRLVATAKAEEGTGDTLGIFKRRAEEYRGH